MDPMPEAPPAPPVAEGGQTTPDPYIPEDLIEERGKPRSPEELLEELKRQLREEVVKQGCPPEKLDLWKEQCGEIGMVPIGNTIYVLRPLSRREFKDCQKQFAAAANSGGGGLTGLDQEEEFALRGCLFPTLDPLKMKGEYKAGVATTLSEAIMQLSGFVQNVVPIII